MIKEVISLVIKEEVILSARAWLECQFCHLQIWVNTSPPKPPNVLLFAGDLVFRVLAAAAAKSLQSCPTLCYPIDGSPPGSPVPGILQARTLEWVAISFSNAWKWKVKVKSLSFVWLLATPCTAAYQASPATGFFRQEYWSGVPVPSLCSEYLKSLKSFFPR